MKQRRSSQPSDIGLEIIARFISYLRELLPERCYGYQSNVLPGQIWIFDKTGRPPYNRISIMVKRVEKGSQIIGKIEVEEKSFTLFYGSKEIEVTFDNVRRVTYEFAKGLELPPLLFEIERWRIV